MSELEPLPGRVDIYLEDLRKHIECEVAMALGIPSILLDPLERSRQNFLQIMELAYMAAWNQRSK